MSPDADADLPLDPAADPSAGDAGSWSPDPDLLDSLGSPVLDDRDQEGVRSEMMAFARHHEDSLLRTCEAGHFTGSALIVDAAGERALVMFHTKAQRWFQPGGHADGQADLAAVALREAEEETGISGLVVVRPAIDVDIHIFRPRESAPHRHLDVRYLVRAPVGAEAVGNHESEALRWVTYDELVALGADDGLRRLARRGFDLAASGDR